MPKSLEELQAIAKRVRREIVEMIGAAGSGHPGGSLSAVEILVELYFNYHAHRSARIPSGRTRPLHSLQGPRGAGALRRDGRSRLRDTPLDKLNTLRKLGSIYQGHPDMRFIPSLEASTGSLGEGLSLALGMGLAARLDGSPSRTYVHAGRRRKSRKARSGKRPWRARSTSSITSCASWITTASSSMASSRTSWTSLRWPINGAPSAGTPSKSTATILPAIQAAFREAEATKGKPTCHGGPHHQGQGRFVHGEQSQVPRHGAHRRPKSNWPYRSCNKCRAKTKFEIKQGPATREAFGRALVELGRENKDIVVCDADLSKSTMTIYFQKEFPDRFVSCGIAEANMVAIGAGLALVGQDSVRFQLLGVRHE